MQDASARLARLTRYKCSECLLFYLDEGLGPCVILFMRSIRTLRLLLGIARRDVYSRAGLSAAEFDRIERRAVEPPWRTLTAIDDALLAVLGERERAARKRTPS